MSLDIKLKHTSDKIKIIEQIKEANGNIDINVDLNTDLEVLDFVLIYTELYNAFKDLRVELDVKDDLIGIKNIGDKEFTYINYKGIDGKDGRDGKDGINGLNGKDGRDGKDGVGIEYKWEGTKLGMKLNNEKDYTFVDLEGLKGGRGPKGEKGTSVFNSKEYYNADDVVVYEDNIYRFNVKHRGAWDIAKVTAISSGGGPSDFTSLTDTPSSYAGEATKVLRVNADEDGLDFDIVSGTGDVVGPASSTDNAIIRFNSTNGKSIQNSNATIDDSGNITATNLSGTNTGDETDASIKTKYENNADTNAFTDAEQTKLTGIEAGAEVNQNAFSTIVVAGQNNVVSDSQTDSLTLIAGTNVTITTDDINDTITINSTGGGGGGDLLSTNNLSDVASTALARQNLGLEIGVNVQAYDSILASTTASYTTAEETKLAGIEAGATADQNALEVPTTLTLQNYITDNTNVQNALSELDTTINGIAAGGGSNNSSVSYNSTTRELSVADGLGTLSAAITEVVAGGNSGLMTGGDKTKLDGIEAGATADQTGAEIKTLYESEANTNAFTDLEKTKLSNAIETSNIDTLAELNTIITDATLIDTSDSRLSDARTPTAHTHTASEITDFDTEVSNNTDVTANTGARHDAVTVTDSAEIDFTLTGQNITASIVAGSIDEAKLDISVNASLDLADSSLQSSDIANFETTTQLNSRDTNNRARANHTGTQTASTISDFDTEVSNNTSVVANTAKVSADGSVTSHNDVTNAGSGAIITTAERSKLSGIEASATADQTGAEIKALYEAEANTNAFTDTEQTKLSNISVTQAVDLDQMELDINALEQAVVLQGTWDASVGTFPGGGTAQAGYSYIVSTGGTVDGIEFVSNDRLMAIVDNASTTTYASNWHKLDYTDAVLSVAGKTGAVTLVKSDVGLTNVDNVSDANKPVSTATQTALDLKQNILSEGAFVDGDKTKLDGIEAGAEVNTIDSIVSGEPTGSDQVINVVSLTQAEYDAGTKVATTFYIING